MSVYATLEALKARLGVDDDGQDGVLELILTGVSRQIDDECQDWFYGLAETRHYTPTCPEHLLVDSLLSVDVGGLKTDEDGDGVFETTWAATDFVLAPYNAQRGSIPRPYWKIEVARNGRYGFPVAQRAVEIAGTWGFSSSPPDVVVSACLYQCELEWHAKDAPGGVAGGGEFATEIRAIGLHPFCKRMLVPYSRKAAA